MHKAIIAASLVCLSLCRPAAAQLPESPLAAIAKRLTQKSAAASGVPAAATRFRPTGTRLLLGEIADTLTEDAEKKKALRTFLEEGVKDYEAAAAKEKRENDVAAALAFFVATQWSVATGKTLEDPAEDALLAQATSVLSTPEMKAAPDSDKQKLYEYCVGMAVFVVGTREVTKSDPESYAGVKTLAAGLFTKMLGVEPAQVRFSASGLILAGTPSPAQSSQSSGSLTYTVPAAWKETRPPEAILFSRPPQGDGDSTSYNLVLLPRTPKQGSLSQTFGLIWKQLVAPRFNTEGHQPFPLPYRTPGGVTLVFEGGYVTTKPGGSGRHVFLYLVDAGSSVIPLLGIEDFGYVNLRSSEEKNVEAFFHSLRLSGAASPKPLFTDRAALVGTWQIGSSSSLDFVSSSGAYVGTRVSFANNTMTLKADGTYDSTLLLMIAGDARRPGKISGVWSLKDGFLTLTPQRVTGDVNDKPIRQRVLTVGQAPSGKTVLVIEGRLSLVTEERSGLPIYEKQEK